MRSVKVPAIERADPAPSKWRYRWERLWLTPLFRSLIRTGIPSLAVVAVFTWYINDDARVAAILDGWSAFVKEVQNRPEFVVSELQVEGASEELRSDIEEALPIDLPLSQFQLDIENLRALLLDLDPVETAEVRIRTGGVLLLKVTERDPAVAWRRPRAVELLDATGHRVATLDDLAEAGSLPLIAGEGADRQVPEALALIEAAAPIADRLVGLTRVGNRRWDVILTGDRRIALPEEAPAAALDRALAMHAAKDVLNRDVTVVDLRLPHRPVLRLSEPARTELRQLRDLERLSYAERKE